jgi:cyclic pyranopterin monophosphate synthase
LADDVKKVTHNRPAAAGTPSGLTHLDARNRPTMVDVGAKEVTHRVATAEARIRFPANVAAALRKSGHRTKKGRRHGRETYP